MKNTTGSVDFLYGNCVGRTILKLILKLHLDKPAVCFLRSRASKILIGRFAKKNQIPLTKEQKKSFKSYREFFVRVRDDLPFDIEKGHLISPCDGWLSAFKIDENSCFDIKNSHYGIDDFLHDKELAKNYQNGTCLVFRLCASDYHHYSFIDDGYQEKNNPIPGVLHSVQPIACEKFPVFVLNKRSWCLMKTDNFGSVVQCEIGALIVGGIVNKLENTRFQKGKEKGHFDLAGSTIVLLFEPNKIELIPSVVEGLSHNEEVRVLQGQWIGIRKPE